jgi:hypothetical protein
MPQQIAEEAVALLTVQAEEDLGSEVLAEAAREQDPGSVPAHAHTQRQLTRDLNLRISHQQ